MLARLRAPLAFLPPPGRKVVSLFLLALNTAVCAMALLSLAIVKLVVPVNAVRQRIDPLLSTVARWWIAGNEIWIGLAQQVQWSVRGLEGLRRDWRDPGFRTRRYESRVGGVGAGFFIGLRLLFFQWQRLW